MGRGQGLLQRLGGSVYRADAYRQVAADRSAALLGYLAVLILLATVVTTALMQVRLGRVLNEAEPWLKDSVPQLRIEKGRLSSPVEQPYVWESGAFVVVLDTTGAVTELNPEYGQGVLITERALIVRRSPTESREYDLSRFPDLVLNDEAWDTLLHNIRSWMWTVVAISTFLWLWALKLIHVLVWSVLGLLVAPLAHRKLTFRALWNISIYALTAPLFYDLALNLLGLAQRPLLSLLSLVLYAGYWCWGIFVQLPAPDSAAARSV